MSEASASIFFIKEIEKSQTVKTVAIIVAAGLGKRMNKSLPKQFLNLAGKPVLAHTLLKFQNSKLVTKLIITLPPGYESFFKTKIQTRYRLTKVYKTLRGGKTRQESVYKALQTIPEDTDFVMVHDGVRPFVDSREIDRTVRLAERKKNVIWGTQVNETVKEASHTKILKTLDRKTIWIAQTPQIFPYKLLLEAHKKASFLKFTGTDDAVLVERLGKKVYIMEGSDKNIKITNKSDLKLAELWSKEKT